MAYHEYIRSLSPALRSCQGRRVHTAGFSYHLSAKIAGYANAAERLLMAIGEPNMVDTAQNPDFPDSSPRIGLLLVILRLKSFTAWKTRLNRLSLIRNMRRKGWKRRNKFSICWDLWGGKSSLAERLKSNAARANLCFAPTASVARSTIIRYACLTAQEDAQILEKSTVFRAAISVMIMSPWAAKRLHAEFGGDITKFAW